MDDLEGLKICIVHYAERLPSADGYRPGKHGRLAEDLTSRGAMVTRLTPTFTRVNSSWNEPVVDSAEGRHVLIDTPAYGKSFSWSRLRFIRAFVSGVSRHLRFSPVNFDAILIGVPPPGMVTAVSRACDAEVRVVADLRDLWPDALGVGKFHRAGPFFRILGRLFSQELRLADAVVAVTPAMAEWAPAAVNARVVPLGMPSEDLMTGPEIDADLHACFLSTHFHGYDFEPVFAGWSKFQSQTGNDGRFTLVGPGVPESIAELAEQYGVRLEVTGRILKSEVHPLLCKFDIGVAPCTEQWSHSLGNKFFDYLAAGLSILHSLEPLNAAMLDGFGGSRRLDLVAEKWFTEFGLLHEQRAGLRLSRQERVNAAQAAFGRPVVLEQILDALCPDIQAQPTSLT